MNQPSQPNSPADRIALPPRMKAALEQYRKRVWAIKLAEGALAAIFGLVISYLVVFGLDRLIDTPALWRAVILVLGSVGAVILFPLKYHHWVWKHRRLEQVARLLRHKHPRFGDHLLGIVELARAESPTGASRALVEAAMRQVDAELEQRDLTDAVPNPRHRGWAWATLLPLALIVLVLGIIPAAGGNAFVRWAMPWRDAERYTFVQLQGEIGRRVVPYAEPFTLQVDLTQDSPWKPEAGSAVYEDQSPILAPREGGTYRFQVPPQTKDGRLSLQVGDARRAIAVEPKMRPALTELSVQVQLPDYLERPEPMIEDVRGGTVNLVKGSTAMFLATATRELAVATLNNRTQSVNGSRLTTEGVTVDASAEYLLAWRDCFGLEAREPQVLRLEAKDDGAPTVGFNQLKNNQVILSSEVITFQIQASDDFGVKRLGLEWEGIADPIYNPEPSDGEKTVAAGTPKSEAMIVAATFSAARERVRPQSLRVRAFAEDYLPDRARSFSPYVVLHVLTSAEHFKWLTEQMSRWVGAAQEVYEKELQLNQINEELMTLPPAALDDPAQRKKVRDQATAERANADNLTALIFMGATLVQEATKNEEFDANQLEAWAEMLQQLEEIAGERMPSVAELLAQAAEAPGHSAGPQTDSPPGEPGETSAPTDASSDQNPSAPNEGKDLGLKKADSYGPESPKPPEGVDQSAEDPNGPGGSVNVDRSKPSPGDPGSAPANPTPSAVDQESGFNPIEKPSEGAAPQAKGGLDIPVTVLKGSGRDEEQNEAPAQTADELVLEAVTEQQDLLDAFGRLAGEMNELLMGFENSTFVKRLKAASRRQIDLAVDLNDLDGFGLESTEIDNLPRREGLGEREVAASETVFTIQEDLTAYADRRPSDNYSRVLEEMLNAAVVEQIRGLSLTINRNLIGQSTIEAEFWADTLDRWAEQLVDPLGKQEPSSPEASESPNLTPEIIVEVLRIIKREIQLREETRELHQARAALSEATVLERGGALSETQKQLADRARDLVGQIRELPDADELATPIEKLTEAAVVMDEVQGLLAIPATGSATIAAISEVIEILLETHRAPNAPTMVKASAAQASALMLVGLGDDGDQAFIDERAPGQATGKAGRELPEEFRQGLDLYLNALEGKVIE